jgi:NAD(P)-dependent dehydrogenase (short-subunit alcohol dehydrogenase family)
VAVVTGGGRGLGRGIALALAEAGFDLVLGWRCDSEAVAATAAAVRATATAGTGTGTGPRVLVVQGDVADPATAKLLLDAAVTLGGPTAWVNNAGVSVLAPILDTDPADMARMVETNLLGTFHGLQAAGRWFTTEGAASRGATSEGATSEGAASEGAASRGAASRGAGRAGRIVNLASDLGVQACANLGGYAATKFAVVGLTQAAAVELAPHGITVNAVCPGTAETDMVLAERASQVALSGGAVDGDDVRASYLDAIPAGRFCTPADVGALVAWLCGPAAGYVTGQAICVNGGSVLH